MPLPLVSLNFMTIASSATCCGPLSACQSVMLTGAPESVMSASVDCWGAGAAALHAALTSMSVARIAAFPRMGLPSTVGGLRPPAPDIPYYAAASTPDARPCDALHEVALGHQEEKHDGSDHEGGRRHEQMVARPCFLPERGETHLDWPKVRLRRDDEGPLEGVPRAKEGDEAGRDQGRHREREDDAPEEPQMACAIDPGGVGELVRDREKELPHQKYRERARDERHDLYLIRVEPSKARKSEARGLARAHEHIVRNERGLAGDHQRRKEEREEGALAAEAHPREGVRGEAGGRELEDRHDHGDEDRVDEVAAPWRAVPGANEVLWVELGRKKGRRRVRRLEEILEGARDHEEEGIRHHYGRENQEDMLHDRPDGWPSSEARDAPRDRYRSIHS